jgi:hypothetical protein
MSKLLFSAKKKKAQLQQKRARLRANGAVNQHQDISVHTVNSFLNKSEKTSHFRRVQEGLESDGYSDGETGLAKHVNKTICIGYKDIKIDV